VETRVGGKERRGGGDEKIYQAVDDPEAEGHGLLRVIDESGEDYLYPDTFFISLDLPHTVETALRRAAG
jgi:hypothetical protein